MKKQWVKILLGSLFALSLPACAELAPVLEEILEEEGGTAASSGSGETSGAPTDTSSVSEAPSGEEAVFEESASTGADFSEGDPSVPAEFDPTGGFDEGFDEGEFIEGDPSVPAEFDTSGGVDFSQYLGPQESVFYYNEATGAGSYPGERISFMTVVFEIFDAAGTTYGQLFMVDNAQPGQRWDIATASGEPFTVATEVLNSAPFVPVSLVMMNDTRVTFQHRESVGNCTNHTAQFDDSQFTIVESLPVSCDF